MQCFVFLWIAHKGKACGRGGPTWVKTGLIHSLNLGIEDKRIPLSWRDIILTSAVYKPLCCVQFNHISQWAESDTITADEQNGFGEKMVHVVTLSANTDWTKLSFHHWPFSSIWSHWLSTLRNKLLLLVLRYNETPHAFVNVQVLHKLSDRLNWREYFRDTRLPCILLPSIFFHIGKLRVSDTPKQCRKNKRPAYLSSWWPNGLIVDTN